MTRAFLRLTRFVLLAGVLAPLVTILATSIVNPIPAATMALLVVSTLASAALLWRLELAYRLRLETAVDAASAAQADFLDTLPEPWTNLAIVGAAATSLFLELSVIRWQSSVFEFFAFYKNFSLIACFFGLGLGYALARRAQIALSLAIPVLACQVLLMHALRYGIGELNQSLRFNVFLEQFSMGLIAPKSIAYFAAIYFFLALIFLLTALAFLPIGQLCGRLMERRTTLSAYGLNLLGSVLGVALTCALSFLWTPPPVWFAVAFVGILLFVGPRRRTVLFGCVSALACLLILAWPTSGVRHATYSPYQLLELGPGKRGMIELRAAGHYFQRVHDLSKQNANLATDQELRHIGDYYDLPYRLHPQLLTRVAVVGAGTGNDVAAALRAGAGQVDAVEIDPAIVQFGREFHPEHPYDSEHVDVVVNDARSFLRTTDRRYDMIVYGLLDSHTLLSHASSVRVDSFVYTIEGFKEARERLHPGGVLSLSFAVLSTELGRKLFLMLQEAFDGKPPVVIFANYDMSVVLLQSKEGDLVPPQALFQNSEFEEISAVFADPTVHADVSTDDWPFFYMPERVYPKSYLAPFVLLLALACLLIWNFFGERPSFGHATFFWLGAGFMLVETKSITELGLVFGNTWLVIGIAIIAILLMAFLANGVVQWTRARGVLAAYALLFASLLLGYWLASSGGLASRNLGPLAATALLTCPMFFSGWIFSTSLASTRDVAGVMAANLLGAVFGGLLEYNSMYFGFGFLHLLALGLYALAGIAWWRTRAARRAQSLPASRVS